MRTLLQWGDLWHALAPSLPRPDPHSLLSIILIVRPIHLLQIGLGASQAAAPEHLPRAKLCAESNKGETLAALLLLIKRSRGVTVVVCVDLVHTAAQHGAKQAGNLVDLSLHLRHQPPEPEEGGAGLDQG